MRVINHYVENVINYWFLRIYKIFYIFLVYIKYLTYFCIKYKKMKTILLDIDYTLFCETTPRPHLKEFLDNLVNRYGYENIYFYTAANHLRITEVCRIMLDLNIDKKLISHLNNYSLFGGNCSMQEFKKNDGSIIEYKSIKKASEVLNISYDNIVLLDDAPSYDHPEKNMVIQAEGFNGLLNDDYLKRIII